jgi:hypothetical protein
MVLVIVVLPPIILIMIGFYKKKVLSFRTMNYPHTVQIIYQSIINVLHEYNLKRDLENKIFSILLIMQAIILNLLIILHVH